MAFKALKIVYLLGVSGMVGWMDEILVDTHYSDSPKRSKYTAYFENTEEQGEGHGGF